jgi:hypothetical protein
MPALLLSADPPGVLPAWAGGIIIAVLALGGAFGWALYRWSRSRR